MRAGWLAGQLYGRTDRGAQFARSQCRVRSNNINSRQQQPYYAISGQTPGWLAGWLKRPTRCHSNADAAMPNQRLAEHPLAGWLAGWPANAQPDWPQPQATADERGRNLIDDADYPSICSASERAAERESSRCSSPLCAGSPQIVALGFSVASISNKRPAESDPAAQAQNALRQTHTVERTKEAAAAGEELANQLRTRAAKAQNWLFIQPVSQ